MQTNQDLEPTSPVRSTMFAEIHKAIVATEAAAHFAQDWYQYKTAQDLYAIAKQLREMRNQYSS